MAFNEALIAELESESKSTRKMLERIAVDTWEYKPHEKSMSMKQLSLLVAQMFGWIPNRSVIPNSISNTPKHGFPMSRPPRNWWKHWIKIWPTQKNSLPARRMK